jgi:hypothetical protein
LDDAVRVAALKAATDTFRRAVQELGVLPTDIHVLPYALRGSILAVKIFFRRF